MRQRSSKLTKCCQKALNSTLTRADNKRFLEQFRYMIVASQLLDSYTLGQQSRVAVHSSNAMPLVTPAVGAHNMAGAILSTIYAFFAIGLLNWTRPYGGIRFIRGRLVAASLVIVVTTILLIVHAKRQWLQKLRKQILQHTANYLLKSHDFDAIASSAFLLVQEVELVSRGYRV